jgi:N-acetylglucosamine kinase-like BadF-type ATPase
MGYILGLDQGSSHTRAVVCDRQGRMLGLGVAEGACHAYVGMQRAMDCVREAVIQSLQYATVRPETLDCIYAGLTGADWEDEYPLLQKNIQEQGWCQNVLVTNDTIVALRGGTAQPFGAILIAGSGGNCAVRAPDGREYIYGYFQENELQGGSGLARHALLSVYHAHTGRGPQTKLTEMILDHFSVQSVEALLRADVENRLTEERLLSLAIVLFEAGFQGDETANRILREFGVGCAELVNAGLRRFDMTGLEVEVVLSGSIFKGKGSLLKETISAGIHSCAPRARLVNARYEPVVGAAMLGLESAGISIDAPVAENIDQTARNLGLIRMDTT